MRLFGLNITRAKAAPSSLSGVDNRGAWWPIVKEAFTGAWQKNVEVRMPDVLAFPAAFRCISLIPSDIAKVRLRLVERDDNGIWSEVENPAFSPVLRKPNRYQTRIQFITSWMESKLIHGNTYVLKERDNRNVVVRLYVLDPNRVTVLVAPDGGVYYRLSRDDISGVDGDVTLPASEIIHDRWNTFYHPLVGLSPIHAAGLAAIQGMHIQQFSAKFFRNNARPGGILSAPGEIGDADVARLKETFEANFTGENSGRLAVLGSGLKFEPTTLTAHDAELISQLRWTGETVCSVFGVPAYKAGIGATPTYDNVSALNQRYYEDCLQRHIEDIEACLDDGLELPKPYGTEFDLDDLLRMDAATQIKMLSEGVRGSLLHPNEGRKKLGLKPTEGGDQSYLQQQNYSLAALAKRDAKDDPFASNQPAHGSSDSGSEQADDADNDNVEAEAAKALAFIEKEFA